MIKQLSLLLALGLIFQAAPVLADNHGDHGGKGKLFERSDTNGDGVISRDEFLNNAGSKFDKMDADGSGDISKDEAKAVREKMKEKRKEFRGKAKERRGGSSE